MRRKLLTITLGGAVLGAWTGPAQAGFSSGLVNVNFNGGGKYSQNGPTPSGAAVVGASGDTWNGFDTSNNDASGTSGGLTNSEGNATAATLDFSSQGAYYETNDSKNPVKPALLNTFLYAQQSSGTYHASVGGLDAATAYDLYVYNGSNTSGRTTNFTLTGASTESADATYTGPAAAFVAGDNYLRFTLNPDANGEIDIAFHGVSSEGDFDGFQITPVPEPASLALLGVGGLLMLPGRRKRA